MMMCGGDDASKSGLENAKPQSDELTERSEALCSHYGLPLTEENLASARERLIATEGAIAPAK